MLTEAYLVALSLSQALTHPLFPHPPHPYHFVATYMDD